MCGIFGLLTQKDSKFTSQSFQATINNLFKLSESRGKEASGLALRRGNSIEVMKRPICGTRLIKTKEYKTLLNSTQPNSSLAVIGHSRLVTNGSQIVSSNNQPVIKGGIVGIHNGIIVNGQQLCEEAKDVDKEFDVDTEAFLGLVKHYLMKGYSVKKAIQNTFHRIEGSASVAMLFDHLDQIALATNNGSIYICTNQKKNVFMFASEHHILRVLMKKSYLKNLLEEFHIEQLKPGQGCLLGLSEFQLIKFSLHKTEDDYVPLKGETQSIEIRNLIDDEPARPSIHTHSNISANPPAEIADHFAQCEASVASLQRCSRCILPKTMPMIEFDSGGVCNFCKNYKPSRILGQTKLQETLARFRNKDGSPDCLVALSGGRDSCYSLHYIKKVLKMNPIAYTYDWGMITDLARRNQSRLCGKLGVEHIIVSADITKKRRFIGKNVLAWMKRPDLGMVPLFMAGDKKFYYYADKLKKQTNTELLIFGECTLEETKFKTGFCNIKEIEGGLAYALLFSDKLKMASYYIRQFILNPAYLNESLWDTISAYWVFYGMKKDYLNIYQYIQWDEDTIMDVLKKEYNWETSPDTRSTWRIGDGTVAFYNYIYYIVAGFSEVDTFRSNQIREGILTRDEALAVAKYENVPRYNSIKEYCDLIGVDYLMTLRAISAVPKRYPLISPARTYESEKVG